MDRIKKYLVFGNEVIVSSDLGVPDYAPKEATDPDSKSHCAGLKLLDVNPNNAVNAYIA